SPSKVLENIEKKKITAFHGVPTMYFALLSEDLEKYDISSLKLCISGGAGLPKEVYEQFLKRTGVSIKEGYGLTECSPVTHVNPIFEPKIGSIGKLLIDTQAKIIDLETNEVMAPGEIGELVIKGPQVMKGYWKKGVETINVFTKDGWLKTGDLAKVDEKEYFYIVDRLKEVINSGGYKIYPREVEEILHQHPAVAIAAVIPKPDDYYGEVVKACIVLKKSQKISKEEITEYCRKFLASYKIAKEIEFTKKLPLSAAGKVLKRELKKNNTT
ncbi:MAG: AMP-binding protein, partial [Candidatus Heimdallarchaeota archaeon]|nr:AMP-binding protein [Candidatus Heimdallarchaeota archaeon]